MAELTGFQARGSHVWLLAPTQSQIVERARQAGVAVQSLNVSKLRWPLNAILLARWFMRQRIEILNTHSSRDGWLAAVAGRIARVPLIIRTRHIDVDYPNRWISRHAFTTLADHILTTSEKIKRRFQDMFQLPSERITVVPTGIDLTQFSPDGPKAQFSGSPPGTLPLVGMVSVLRSWKGHPIFLRAIQILTAANFPARYVIVGEGPQRSQIESRIRDLHFDSIVSLAGHREDVPEVLRALNVLVMPSTDHEGIPQAGLQALATKTPVIGSDIGGIPEIIKPDQTGRLVPAGNPEALAAAIRDALSDQQTTKRFASAGRELVERHYSLESMLDKVEAVYRRHLGNA